MTGGSDYNLIVLVGAPPQVPAPPWAGIAIGVALFAAMALLVRHRARQPELRPPSRPFRILETAAIWSAAYTAMRMPELVETVPLVGISIALGFAAAASLFMVTALLLVGAADLLLDMFAPRRTLFWLLAGPLLLAGFAVGFLAATGWMEIVTSDPGWREAMLLAAALLAGLGWWSRLPLHRNPTAEIFE
jgi:hypothetical protein